MKQRGFQNVRLIVSDNSTGRLDAIGDFFPESRWQRCVVHFYRNVLNAVPAGKSRAVSAMLKAIHAQEEKRPLSKKRNRFPQNSRRFVWKKPPALSRQEPRKLSFSMSFRPITGVISGRITLWSDLTVKPDGVQE
ncbi:MAG: transposase [Bilophila wadsworthia]|nr:transposase [Bilophila wadsworthia]